MKEERILIIEDEIIVAAGIENMLRKFGYTRIESADNAERGAELLASGDYDLVLTDINLGRGTDGIDLIAEVKKTKDIRVIYLTGNADKRTLARAKTTTPLAYITKPVSETNLRIQLDLFIGR